MRQTLHIFSKDVRYLRIETLLLFLLAAAFGWVKIHIRHDEWSDALVALAAVYIIGRAVHADPVPGDRQFWLTRPYHRASLLCAKLLYVVVCVCAPIALAQIAVLLAEGFPFSSALPGLLWDQTLIFALGAVPVIVLAALTSSVVPFILTGLVLALISFGATTAVDYWFPAYSGTIPGSVDWVRSIILALTVLFVAALVLLWQYRDRSTGFSRIFAIAGFTLMGLGFLFMPGSVPHLVQSWLSKQPAPATRVTISVTRSDHLVGIGRRGKNARMFIPFTVVVADLPNNVEIGADSVSVSMEWPDRKWLATVPPVVNRRSESESTAIFDFTVVMTPELFREKRDQSLAVRGSVFLTLFGDDERRTVSLLNGPVNVQDGLRCGTGQIAPDSEALVCRSLFRWPARLVYAQSGGHQSDFNYNGISFSPFPAEMSLDPREERWADSFQTDPVTIITRKPLAHFRRDFELRGIRLADFGTR